MASNDLVFGQLPNAPGGPVEIVFGDDTGLPPGVSELTGAGRITGLRGHVIVRTVAHVAAAGRITGLRLRMHAVYDINVTRLLARTTRQQWQPAQPISRVTQSRYGQAQPLGATVRTQWQHARAIGMATRQQWQNAQPLQQLTRQQWQHAIALGTAPVRQQFETAEPVRNLVRQQWQTAHALAAAPVQQRFEDAVRLRHIAHQQWQQAQPIAAAVRQRFAQGMPLAWVRRQQYQDARKPPPGKTPRTPPPLPAPCYVPGLPAELLFELAHDATLPAPLVFVCERHTPPGPEPEPPRYVIPKLEIYVSVHSLNAVLLPSLEPVALLDANIDSDDGGFGWGFTANGPEHLLDQLAPVGGQPARVRLTIDGIDWVFAIERIARTRSFGKHRASLQGRSVTALLGDPYMPVQSWLNSSDMTAEQIVAQALEYTGTALDWNITDWLVPAGAWSFQGTPLQAALRVAEGVGGVLRSHRTDAQLIYAPRYPVLPWAWGGAAVNVQMPADIIVTDDLQPDPRPGYDAVYVTGQAGGLHALVRRAGTAGELLAPQVTDALITHADAARQRGESVLGGAGPKLTHTLNLPLLTGELTPGVVAPGLIEPGYLLEVLDIGHTWRGLVRGIRVTASVDQDRTVVRQAVTVERSA